MYIQKCEVLSSFLLFIILTDIEIKNHDNPFQPTGLFLYPPPKKKKKISENQRISDVFRGYRKRPVE